MKPVLRFLFILIISLACVSCSQRSMVRKYYTLETKTALTSQELGLEKPLPLNVEVRDFQVAKVFDQTNIALREESNELNYYFYHFWAVRPATAVADLVYQLVDQTGLFQRATEGYASDSDYIITGIVHQLERTQVKNKETGHIGLTFQLLKSKSELPVLRYTFDRQIDLKKDRSMNGFARVMSDILRQETEEFIRRMAAYFSPPENPPIPEKTN